MKKIISSLLVGLVSVTAVWAVATNEPAAPTAPAVPAVPVVEKATAPNLDEVVKALRAHYVDRDKLDAQTLDAATIKGILSSLGRGAILVAPEPVATNATTDVSLSMTNVAVAIPEVEPLARAEVIDPNIGYIRVSEVSEDTVAALDLELKKFNEEKCDGYILDLRFADGTNLTAAAAVASRFFDDERELFVVKTAEQGEQIFKSRPVTDGVTAKQLATAPLMLLVNSQTRGAAEALVGALRAQDRGVVVGGMTAGSPASVEDITLSDGQILRVATSKVVLTPVDPKSLANVDIFPHGVAPDIYVPLALSVEQDVVLKASTNVTLTVSLQPHAPKKRMTEADLVKAFRGEAVDTPPSEDAPTDEATGSEDSGEIQKVRDVVLQRAVDVLKGIRVLLTWQ